MPGPTLVGVSLPIPTTTITVKRRAHDAAADAFDPDTSDPVTVVSGWPAHFSGLTAVESADGNSQTTKGTLLADPMDLRHIDLVINEADLSKWEVRTARAVEDPDRPPPENDSHVTADVVRVSGVA